MKYRINGADAKTGADRSVVIQASEESEALTSARNLGLFPYHCEAVPEPPSTSIPAAPQQSRSIPSRTDNSEDPIRCPQCRCTQITANVKGFGLGKAAVGGVLLGPVGLLGGLMGSKKVKITCLKCGHSWLPGS